MNGRCYKVGRYNDIWTRVKEFEELDKERKRKRREEKLNELELQKSEDKEIPSRLIGEMVMDKMKNLDPVAYVRFASVYREFKDINTFMDELKKVLDK